MSKDENDHKSCAINNFALKYVTQKAALICACRQREIVSNKVESSHHVRVCEREAEREGERVS